MGAHEVVSSFMYISDGLSRYRVMLFLYNYFGNIFEIFIILTGAYLLWSPKYSLFIFICLNNNQINNNHPVMQLAFIVIMSETPSSPDQE